MKSVSIRYFAKLREERGLSEETRQTKSLILKDLYEELQSDFGLSLSVDSLKAAVNGDYQAWDYQLQESDEVVFIPPVAGG